MNDSAISDLPAGGCLLPGCGKPLGKYRKICQSHRRKMRLYGSYDGRPKQTIEERFWAKVDKRGPDECWPWGASDSEHGYGWFKFRGKMVRAHRIAWLFTHGSLREDEVVRHRCDNPPCCNPTHLLNGTQAQNVADMDERDRRRSVRGEQVGNARLTAEQVIEIRQAYSPSDEPTWTAIGRLYGVSGCTVRDVVRRRTWRHLP